MRRMFYSTCLAALMLASVAGVAEARRVALVIGNGAYQSLSALSNPTKDAFAVAEALRARGFDVSEYSNLPRADFLDALENFQQKAKGAELAVVFYAGHGMEIAGKDLLAPVDMEISCDPKEARRSVGLDKLFEASSGASNQVVLLDSCRNDPFPNCPTRSARQGSGFRGLSRVNADGTILIANATLSGDLAADGNPGEHSPFAKALLDRFSTSPNAYFRDLLDQVAQDVRLASNGAQTPEVTSRGGLARLCLSLDGCSGETGAKATNELLQREVAGLLSELGFLRTRSPDTATLEVAVREFQEKSGLTVDGQATPTLLALLTTLRLQGGLSKDKVFSGRTEHAVGSTFKDCDDCPEMVVVPDGKITLGSPQSEAGRQKSEGPQVEVTIGKPFAVSKLEVTYDQWESCALEGGCGGYRPKDAGGGKGNLPVAYVSWDDAKAYVSWLRQRTGLPYRLLSEAEWEYAAKAGASTAYSTGSEILTTQANFDGSQLTTARKVGDYLGHASEVGSYPANGFGLHDMHGNVAEWVEDCWNDSHAGASADGSPRSGDCSRRLAKGGAWYFEAPFARAAARMSYPKQKRLNIVGFRIARDLE
ncbi:MAG: SUMF1/EgtB/PvdO family nonheme iron enzyme [Parvibaculaceae bacterium]